MNSVPTRKLAGDLQSLTKVDWKKLIPGKIYFIRMRNLDKSKNVWGFKKDFIGKINLIDNTGISFDAIYSREADPRNGKSTWKKENSSNSRVLILKEALIKKNPEDNTTFYIDPKNIKNTTRRLPFNFKKLFTR